jgi:hypothetical protein
MSRTLKYNAKENLMTHPTPQRSCLSTFLRSTLHYGFLAALLPCLIVITGCGSTKSSGSAYKMMRVQPKVPLLVDAHRVFEAKLTDEEAKNDELEKPIQSGEGIQLYLNGGYLRYLESLHNPEVMIFITTRVFPDGIGSTSNPVVYTHIYQSSNDQSRYMQFGSGVKLPKMDIAITPAIEWKADSFMTVELRIIELDQGDNERYRELIDVAATAGAALQPQSAVAVSVVQSTLDYLTLQNQDDIEFQFDFGMSYDDDGPIKTRLPNGKETSIDQVFIPRPGQYVITKAERQDRLVPPDDYLGYLPESLFYLLKVTLKVGTLNILNFVPRAYRSLEGRSPEAENAPIKNRDIYSNLTFRPFEPSFESMVHHRVDKDGYVREGSSDKLFYYYGGELHRIPKKTTQGEIEPYYSQTHLVLTLKRSEFPIPATSIQELAGVQEALSEIQTVQRPIEELAPAIRKIKDSLTALGLEKIAKTNLKRALKNANTQEEVNAAQQEFENAMKEILPLISDETRTFAEKAAKRFAADQARGRLGEITPSSAVANNFQLEETLYLLGTNTSIVFPVRQIGKNILDFDSDKPSAGKFSARLVDSDNPSSPMSLTGVQLAGDRSALLSIKVDDLPTSGTNAKPGHYNLVIFLPESNSAEFKVTLAQPISVSSFANTAWSKTEERTLSGTGLVSEDYGNSHIQKIELSGTTGTGAEQKDVKESLSFEADGSTLKLKHSNDDQITPTKLTIHYTSSRLEPVTHNVN